MITKCIDIQDEILKRVGVIADREGIAAYVVGGYVRDILLGREGKDTDIVVIGSGVEFAKIVAKDFGRTNLILFENFGTAMLPLDDRKLEFVGARKESYRKDSRNPHVEAGTLNEDLSRRDFTVNAMAASLNEKTFGEIIDPFNCEGDLQEKILRTPLDPEVTFDDDPLRIMRAMRFASQLGFTIEPNVLNAAQKMAGRLAIVSQERISDEFLKIMSSSAPSIGLQLMYDSGVLQVVFPEVAQMAGVDQLKEYHHKDVFKHTLQVVDKVAAASDNLWLRMAALLHDIGKPKTKAFKPEIGWTFHGHEDLGARMAKRIFRRMRFPLENLPYIEKLIRLHLRPQALVDDGVTDSAVRRLMFETGNDIDDLMVLCRADITSKNQKLVEHVKRNYELVITKMVEVEEKDRIRNWQPPLRGEEIMSVCGLTEGPMVGVLKDKITDAILDGAIPNEHDAALQYLLSIKNEVMNRPPMKKRRYPEK
ncbi:MAG: HD domain-containing protein [Ignavibacteriales bacterium]|nr:HD domain-containing protein [Ignavibacteriales bacterium]